jgi:hypothetical protein
MRLLIAAVLLSLAVMMVPARAADLNRCIGADGNPVFTDKPCEDVGATLRPQPPAAAPSGSAPAGSGPSTMRLAHSRDCARTPDALREGLRSALATGDVNQVAAFYHWPGISSAESEGILTRLQTIAARPLLSLDLIRPHQTQTAEDHRTIASEQVAESAMEPAAIEPAAIEIVQARTPDDPERVRTVLPLTQYAGCWWVRF